MKEDTRKLLEECNSGCKMAIRSMDQVEEFVKEDELHHVLETYKRKHEALEAESTCLLEHAGEKQKEPGAMASAFSWLTAEMKLKIKNDSDQVAKIMMNGCNMGIQSISKYRNQYEGASEEAKKLADELVKLEEHFAGDLKSFLGK